MHFGLVYIFVEGVQFRVFAVAGGVVVADAVSLLNRRNRGSVVSHETFS